MAESYPALPDCEVVIEQVPAARNVTVAEVVLPARDSLPTKHTADVAEPKSITNPRLLSAEIAAEPEEYAVVPGFEKLESVWLALLIAVVSELFAELIPDEFVAVTKTCMYFPASSTASKYVEEFAPEIRVAAPPDTSDRNHS